MPVQHTTFRCDIFAQKLMIRASLRTKFLGLFPSNSDQLTWKEGSRRCCVRKFKGSLDDHSLKWSMQSGNMTDGLHLQPTAGRASWLATDGGGSVRLRAFQGRHIFMQRWAQAQSRVLNLAIIGNGKDKIEMTTTSEAPPSNVLKTSSRVLTSE